MMQRARPRGKAWQVAAGALPAAAVQRSAGEYPPLETCRLYGGGVGSEIATVLQRQQPSTTASLLGISTCHDRDHRHRYELVSHRGIDLVISQAAEPPQDDTDRSPVRQPGLSSPSK